jgi:hypothetical protein
MPQYIFTDIHLIGPQVRQECTVCIYCICGYEGAEGAGCAFDSMPAVTPSQHQPILEMHVNSSFETLRAKRLPEAPRRR